MINLNTYIVLDRSGSMEYNWEETLGSINGYVAALENSSELNNNITLVAFDSVAPFEIVRDAVTLEDWRDVTRTEISPRGGTPLYTAVAKTLELAESADHEKVVVVVMTDGQDTGNVEHTRESVKAKIEHATKERGWEIVFLGANFDASSYTSTLGLSIGKSINTSNTMRGATMTSLAAKTMAYGVASNAMTSAAAMNFTIEEQKVAQSEQSLQVMSAPVKKTKVSKTK